MKFDRLIFWVLGGALTLPGWSVEPPLPGEDGPPPVAEVFQPLLEPGDVLPPGSEAPPMPEAPAVLPPELFPEGMPGSDGIDGLPVSPLPEVPRFKPPGELAPLLPPPAVEPSTSGFELAARAYWHKNPREAHALSKKERKPHLLFFYTKWKSAPMASLSGGSGDNNIALSDDLLATEEFNQFAAGRVVLTRLFYPGGSPNKDEYPPARLEALQQFKDYFKVKGLPAIILLDENGREIERVKGYTRVKTGRGVDLSSAQPILERLKLAVERREAVMAAADEKLNRLLAQNYREWTSQAGTRLMAKLVSAAAGEVILMDDAGALRRVHPEQLCIVDQAWIHRNQKGKQQAAAGE